jgi:hypothetical protein
VSGDGDGDGDGDGIRTKGVIGATGGSGSERAQALNAISGQ